MAAHFQIIRRRWLILYIIRFAIYTSVAHAMIVNARFLNSTKVTNNEYFLTGWQFEINDIIGIYFVATFTVLYLPKRVFPTDVSIQTFYCFERALFCERYKKNPEFFLGKKNFKDWNILGKNLMSDAWTKDV